MNKNKKSMTTSIVIVFLLLIGIVYAILQANLQINGTAKIQANTWDIHFDNIQVNSNSVSIGTGDSAATIDPEDTSKVDFSVTLSTPGDFYEFTVDVVNAGTIDGMIGTLNKTLKVNNEVVSEVPNYLSYNVTYDDGTEILDNHLIKAGRTYTFKVRIEFKTDIEELPSAATISTSLEPQYVQADSAAVRKIPYNPCTYDGELIQGAEYVNGQYTYRYMQESTGSNWQNISSDGWGVHLSNPTLTDPVTSRLCTSINEKPIVSMSNMFYNSQTTSIDTSSFDTSNVINMSYMFYKSAALTSLDVSGFDTSKVTNMHSMFDGNMLTKSPINQLTQIIGIENFDTSNVTDMGWLFAHNPNLTKLDLRNFDTSKVTNMHSMFNASYGLEEIKGLENFNTSNVTDMKFMFANDESSTPMNLKSLNLTSFDTSKVTVMAEMFERCTSLKELDLSSFNMTNVTNTSNMFNQCTSLTTGYARTQADADKFNNSTNKPSGVTFVVKP